MAYTVDDIRNIALIGHGDVGKTTLAEAMLHKAGATNRLGSVDDGTAVTDYTAEERERKISIDTSTRVLLVEGQRVQYRRYPRLPGLLRPGRGGSARR